MSSIKLIGKCLYLDLNLFSCIYLLGNFYLSKIFLYLFTPNSFAILMLDKTNEM